MRKLGNFYLGLTGDKNVVYDPLLPNEKYSDLIQMLTDNLMDLKVKYGYYNFFPEKLYEIPRVYSWNQYNGCKPHLDDCIKLLKRVNRIIQCT
jgi:hypothetical protein